MMPSGVLSDSNSFDRTCIVNCPNPDSWLLTELMQMISDFFQHVSHQFLNNSRSAIAVKFGFLSLERAKERPCIYMKSIRLKKNFYDLFQSEEFYRYLFSQVFTTHGAQSTLKCNSQCPALSKNFHLLNLMLFGKMIRTFQNSVRNTGHFQLNSGVV